MDCSAAKDLLARNHSPDPNSALGHHAAGCQACRALLEGERRLSLGCRILEKCPEPPDLRQVILADIARLTVPHSGFNPLLRFFGLFRPNSPLKASLVYGLAGLVIFALCHRIISQATDLQNKTLPGWEITQLRGAPATDPGGLTFGHPSPFPPGAQIDLPSGSEVLLAQPGRVEIRLTGARVQASPEEIILLSGSGEILVFPGASEVSIRTPLGVVRGIDSRFAISLTETRLQVNVIAGTIRVKAGPRDMVLKAGEEAGFPSGLDPSPAPRQ